MVLLQRRETGRDHLGLVFRVARVEVVDGAKIQQQRVAAGAQVDIARLDVQMQVMAAMDQCQGIEQGREHGQDESWCSSPPWRFLM